MNTPLHTFVASKAQHYIAVSLRYFDGPRVASAYLTPNRIYTDDLCLDRNTGALINGRVFVEFLGASVHYLGPADLINAALWGPWGWQWLSGGDESTVWQWLSGGDESTVPRRGPRWSVPALIHPLGTPIASLDPRT